MSGTAESLHTLDVLTVEPFGFDQEQVEQTLGLISKTNSDEFRLSASTALEEHGVALGSLRRRICDQAADAERFLLLPGESRGSIIVRRATGYLAAFKILELAAPEGLMKIDEQSIRAYEQRVLGDQTALEMDIILDYGKHPAINWLLSVGLTHEDTRFGAMIMLGLHGKQANPTRPPITLDYKDIESPPFSSQRQRWSANTGQPIMI